MPDKVQFALQIFAACCFMLSAWQWSAPYWSRIVSIGLVALTLSFMKLPLQMTVSFELPEETFYDLRVQAARLNTSVAELIRAAISTDFLLRDAVRGGGKVLLENGRELREVLLPIQTPLSSSPSSPSSSSSPPPSFQ